MPPLRVRLVKGVVSGLLIAVLAPPLATLVQFILMHGSTLIATRGVGIGIIFDGFATFSYLVAGPGAVFTGLYAGYRVAHGRTMNILEIFSAVPFSCIPVAAMLTITRSTWTNGSLPVVLWKHLHTTLFLSLFSIIALLLLRYLFIATGFWLSMGKPERAAS